MYPAPPVTNMVPLSDEPFTCHLAASTSTAAILRTSINQFSGNPDDLFVEPAVRANVPPLLSSKNLSCRRNVRCWSSTRYFRVTCDKITSKTWRSASSECCKLLPLSLLLPYSRGPVNDGQLPEHRTALSRCDASSSSSSSSRRF